MNEQEVMTMLMDANPVRASDLTRLDPPELRRRRLTTRRVAVVAVVVAALAAAGVSIAVFASFSSRPGGAQFGGLGGPVVPCTNHGSCTNNGSWQTISLADGSTTLGAPVVLPSTELVGPSDADEQVRALDCPSNGDTRYPCVLFVHFPNESLGISYTRPIESIDLTAAYEAVVEYAATNPHQSAQLVDLNGVPAVWVDYPGVKRVLEFVVDGTRIDISTTGSYDEPTLQAVAQSIVDRSK